MLAVALTVNRLGGMAHKRQLVARGARDLDLTRAVRDGSVLRARQGWYTTLAAQSPEVRAVRVGGRLTGISAVRHSGGWVLDEHPLHVSVVENSSRLRSPTTLRVPFAKAEGRVQLHWDERSTLGRGTAVAVELADALLRVVLDEPVDAAVAALDWALHSRRLDRMEFELLILRLPTHRRWIAGWVDDRCESLPESLSRTRLRLAGHRVTSQVPLGSERIDLVVDDVVGLEVDGEEFHLDRFEADRRKDMTMTLAGYHAMRPSARMVFRDWHTVQSAIESAIAARRTGGNTPPAKALAFT